MAGAPINPNTGRPFAAGDSVNAKNRQAYNDFSGWQQNQMIDSWNRGTMQNAQGRQPKPLARAPGQSAPPAQSPGQQPAPQPSPQQPNPLAYYQSGFNADRQAINQGNVVGRMQAESQFAPQGLSGDGARAVEDQRRAQLANDTAQMRRGMELQNSQQHMKDQVARSELMQQGLANQAKIYGDIVGREVSQIGLASQLQQAMLRSRNAFMNSLLSMQT